MHSTICKAKGIIGTAYVNGYNIGQSSCFGPVDLHEMVKWLDNR